MGKNPKHKIELSPEDVTILGWIFFWFFFIIVLPLLMIYVILPLFGVRIAMDFNTFLSLFVFLATFMTTVLLIPTSAILRRLVPRFEDTLSPIAAGLIVFAAIFYLLLAAPDWFKVMRPLVDLIFLAFQLGPWVILLLFLLLILVFYIQLYLPSAIKSLRADKRLMLSLVGIFVSMMLLILGNVFPQGEMIKFILSLVALCVMPPSILYVFYYFYPRGLGAWLEDMVALVEDRGHYYLNLFIAALISLFCVIPLLFCLLAIIFSLIPKVR